MAGDHRHRTDELQKYLRRKKPNTKLHSALFDLYTVHNTDKRKMSSEDKNCTEKFFFKKTSIHHYFHHPRNLGTVNLEKKGGCCERRAHASFWVLTRLTD